MGRKPKRRTAPSISARIRSDPPRCGVSMMAVLPVETSRKKAIKRPSGDQAGL